jgi:guanine deaminase
MKTAVRGAMLSFTGDPYLMDLTDCMVYEPDAVIVMEDGIFTTVGPAATVLPDLPADLNVQAYPDHLMLPGFIDAHVHYPQTPIIASHGKQLIDWLNNYTFIAEQAFRDKAHATEVARIFLQEQLRNGITSSCVFCTTFPESVDALFEQAERLDMRMMAGKVCMDRNAPDALLDTPERAYDESAALIEKWHQKGRMEYVLTPRFAPTSSEAQLDLLGTLANEHPNLLIQSHISENVREVAWVKLLFPWAKSYTDVYLKYGLLRERAIYGHGIHLDESELSLFHERGASLAHCPTSNFFLGSGYLNVRYVKDPKRPVAVGLGTDIGAGTSFSILQTLGEAYKAAHLNSSDLSPAHAFYLATRGAAQALGIDHLIGSIAPGMEADLTVLQFRSTPIIEYRMRYAKNLAEQLFIQMTMGDDRAIAATYVAGQLVYDAAS